MKDRIRRHQSQRPAEWATIEQYRNFESLGETPDFVAAEVILLDCLTVLITNNMMDFKVDYDEISMETFAKIERPLPKLKQPFRRRLRKPSINVPINTPSWWLMRWAWAWCPLIAWVTSLEILPVASIKWSLPGPMKFILRCRVFQCKSSSIVV